MAKKHRVNKKVLAITAVGIALFVAGLVVVLNRMQKNSQKESINKANHALFDAAEKKMKSMPESGADQTTYQRSCSFASAKFGSDREPNCRVARVDLYGSINADRVVSRYGEIMSGFMDVFDQAIVKKDREVSATALVSEAAEHRDPVSGLTCYIIGRTRDGASPQGYKLTVTTACYKEVPYQLYKERS